MLVAGRSRAVKQGGGSERVATYWPSLLLYHTPVEGTQHHIVIGQAILFVEVALE